MGDLKGRGASAYEKSSAVREGREGVELPERWDEEGVGGALDLVEGGRLMSWWKKRGEGRGGKGGKGSLHYIGGGVGWWWSMGQGEFVPVQLVSCWIGVVYDGKPSQQD